MKENKGTICEVLSWNQINSENLSFLNAMGVDGLSINGLPVITDKSKADDIKRIADFVRSFGLKVYDMRWSVPDWSAITNGRENRYEQIDLCCSAIRAIGSADVPFCGYTFMSIGHFRTTSKEGRGGAKYSSFNLDEFIQNNPDQTEKISKEKLWQNLEYFLKKVIPIAEEAKVRLALHPDDPPIDISLGGAPRIIISPENYQKVFDLVPSESNAMLFCQGCFAEMGVDVIKSVKDFAEKNKICMVHFRNIRGNPYDFVETFIDEGEVNMYETMKAYCESGFFGPFIVDHIPTIPQSLASKAYAIGYIRATIQAVYNTFS
ncbi:MAG: mannonate dehydratase [Candidatus Poribacteria bacterium]